jgi:hypothetical protein
VGHDEQVPVGEVGGRGAGEERGELVAGADVREPGERRERDGQG